MFSIVITERGGAQRLLEIDAAEAGIGRLEDNEVVLPRSNVSKRHARIVMKDDRCVLIDLKSTNGTYVNGRKISAPTIVGAADKIYIGDFILTLAQAANHVTSERRVREHDGDTRRVPSLRPSEPEPSYEPGLGAPAGVEPLLPRLSDRPALPESQLLEARPPGGAEPARGRPAPRAPSAPVFAPGPQTPLYTSEPPAFDGGNRPSPLPHALGDDDDAAADGGVPTIPPPLFDNLDAQSDVQSDAPSEPAPDAPPEPEDEALRQSDERVTGERLNPVGRSAPPTRPFRGLSDRPIDPSAPHPSERRPFSDRPRGLSTPSTAPRKLGSIPPRLQDPSIGGPATSPAVLSPSVRLQGALSTLMERLARHMDTTEPSESAFPSEHMATLDELIDDLAATGVVGPDLDRRFLTQAAMSEAVGLGPLDRLLGNRAVREVVVDGPSRILADLGGGLNAVSSFFSSSIAVTVIGKRLLHRAGLELTAEPVQIAQLPDGMQVQVLMPPLAPTGPLLSVRCPPRAPSVPDGLVTEGMLSLDMLALLRKAVQRKLNILVAGPMATGVSTLLGALGALGPDHERLLAIQEWPSLSIDHPHVLPLHRNAIGSENKTFSDLLRIAARMRPDRVLIDDVRSEDSLALLMNAASWRGLVAGMHAPSPASALEQLELFAQVELGGARASLASLVAQSFQLLVHVSMDSDGARRVTSIAEIRGARESTLELRQLYKYDHGFKPTEHRAQFDHS